MNRTNHCTPTWPEQAQSDAKECDRGRARFAQKLATVRRVAGAADQPVYLRITNRSDRPIRLYLLAINPNYFTPLEAAAANHFSIFKRLATSEFWV